MRMAVSHQTGALEVLGVHIANRQIESDKAAIISMRTRSYFRNKLKQAVPLACPYLNIQVYPACMYLCLTFNLSVAELSISPPRGSPAATLLINLSLS